MKPAFLLSTFLVSVFFLASATKIGAVQTGDDPDSDALRKHSSELIKQLGSEKYSVRVEAEEKLLAMAPLVRDLLAKAAQSTDPEVAARARKILGSISKPNLHVVDALGNPIPFAKVKISGTGLLRELHPRPIGLPDVVDKSELIDQSTYSDASGGIFVKKYDRGSLQIEIEQADYGGAYLKTGFPLRDPKLHFPLVEAKSPAAKRALSGIVKDSDGKIIRRASIHGFTVRTSGEGLINPILRVGQALTNSKGEFRFYLPNQQDSQRGKLIPLNSNYRIQVSMPGDSQNIPIGGRYNNQQIAKITFALNDRIHRFRFETVDGIQPTAEKYKTNYFVTYLGRDGQDSGAKLDITKATTGVKLKQGVYRASLVHKGRQVHFQPLKVNQSSKEELLFRLPPKTEFRGRVVNGRTNQPMPNALVIAYSAIGKGNLASLSNEDWRQIKKLEMEELEKSPIVERINKIYSIRSLVRTNSKGEFRIIQPALEPAYGLIALDHNCIPYSIPYFHLLPKPKDPYQVQTIVKSKVTDFPLFPAARVEVTPVVDRKKLDSKRPVSVLPVWQINPANQPKWVKQFKEASQHTKGDFEYDNWLEHNKKQSVFVPAGLNLNVKFDVPYNEFISPIRYKSALNLKQGEVKNLGEIGFQKSLSVVVKVLDQDGNPVEGLPIRRKYDSANAWSLVHNTDALGQTIFGVDRNTKGKFRLGETQFTRPTENELKKQTDPKQPLFIDFKVMEKQPGKEYLFRVNAEQIKNLRKPISLPRN